MSWLIQSEDLFSPAGSVLPPSWATPVRDEGLSRLSRGVTDRRSGRRCHGAAVEDDAVPEQPSVQRRSVLLLPVGVEGSGEGGCAAEEGRREGEEGAAVSAPQVRPPGEDAVLEEDDGTFNLVSHF